MKLTSLNPYFLSCEFNTHKQVCGYVGAQNCMKDTIRKLSIMYSHFKSNKYFRINQNKNQDI